MHEKGSLRKNMDTVLLVHTTVQDGEGKSQNKGGINMETRTIS